MRRKNRERKVIPAKNIRIWIAVILLILITYITVMLISNINKNKKTEIHYTDQLNSVTYVDENGAIITEYENGDKTIETPSKK